MNKNLVIGIIAVVALGAGFGGGYFFRNYQLTKQRANFGMGGAQRFLGNRTGANGMMRGGTIGTILSIDDKSITVKLLDGSSKIVLFSTSTTYSNTVVATKTDLKIGSEVVVAGTANSDGSLTATNIQIRPVTSTK